MVVINTKEMLKFYKSFDALDFKYAFNQEKYFKKKQEGEREEKGKEKNEKKEYVEKYKKLEGFESARQFTELTKVEYGDILTNLDLIYADQEQSDQIVMLFDLIRNKIIHQYINIEGLERLFSEKYIDFEWEMHLGIDYKKHQMEFYRDHFVHQIRNAYCMHVLLEKFQFAGRIKETLKAQNNSKISQYVYKCIEQQKMTYCPEAIKAYHNDAFYYRNIIYMSSYMSALFHDIGYPEVHNAINQGRITEYIANLYNVETSGYNYPRLNALLQNSLLFRVVSFEEIRKRLSEEHPDHGAFSAIIFLLNFYENGAIHGLSSYKKCAVELAALAIYNHTNTYRYQNALEPGDYVRCVFALNPISYLLRLCDDLQEWGRIYFELSHRSKLILCNTCKTPIVRKELGEKAGEYVGIGIKQYYACNCNYLKSMETEEKQSKTEIEENQLKTEADGGKAEKEAIRIAESSVFQPIFESGQNFPYRRIYNVTVCENLELKEDEGTLCFFLKYDLAKLLQIAYINPGYAKFRVKELNQFKRMLDFQKELPKMKIQYFMTANPILIKTQIVTEYLNSRKLIQDKVGQLYQSYQKAVKAEGTAEEHQETQAWEKEFDELLKKWQGELKKVIEKVYLYQEEEKYSRIVESAEASAALYLQLTLFMELWKRCNQGRCSGRCLAKKAKKEWKNLDKEKDEVQELVADSWKQFERMYLDIRKIESNPEKYYQQFKMSDYTYGCIMRFVSSDNYVPVLGRKENETGIDAFTDLKLIKELLKSASGG